jgi:hypothetical protein
MYGTHTLAFQDIFCNFMRMKIISLILIRFSYVSPIRNANSVTARAFTCVCKLPTLKHKAKRARITRSISNYIGSGYASGKLGTNHA